MIPPGGSAEQFGEALKAMKLDGKISQEFYDCKSDEWQAEQLDIVRKMEMHQNAHGYCIEEGIRIFELADKAYLLFEKQEMSEKRELLNFVFSNSIWKDGKLHPNYRKPFDLIVEAR